MRRSTGPVEVLDVTRSVARDAEARARETGRPVLATAGLPVEPATPLRIPASAPPGTTSGWWAEPGFSAAGTDVAVAIETEGPDAFAEASERLEKWFAGGIAIGREPVAFAGGSFSGRGPGGRWSGFPAATAWVPGLAAIEDARGSWLVASTLVFAGDAETAAEHLAATLATGASASPPPQGEHHATSPGTSLPDDEDWDGAVRAVLARISAGDVDKVVLARQHELLNGDANPWAAAATFAGRYPECFGFAAGFGNAVLVGASPELLVRRAGRHVESAPAAGTVERGRDGLDAPKMVAEQAIVADAVETALSPFCTTLERDPAMRRAAGPVEHLSTRIHGELKENTPVLDLVAALHPTPAVAGAPANAALDLIRAHEPFDRGWYSGPIGVVEPGGDGTFALALRCALVDAGITTVYAGAGIVSGSDPASERTEVGLKLRAAAEVV